MEGIAAERPKNILFIAVDDLRPELACYDQSMIQSPNIDRLAESGTRFSRAYCNVPVCGASRASILSGVRPGPGRFVSYKTKLDEDVPGAVSLPMHFRHNGYTTVSLGKIFHHQNDSRGSWDRNWRPELSASGSWRDYQNPENIALDTSTRSRGLPYEKGEVADDAYYDGKIANRAIEELEGFENSEEPFFLAVGFLKPHLPFNAPAKYWDLYPHENIKLPDFMKKPKGAPDEAMHTFGELRSYAGIPKEGPVSEAMALNLIHGYYACVSYMDAQVGKLLAALDASGMAENTIVVLWGDHGWNLGDHGLWCKHCNFEKVLRVPLLMRVPGEPEGNAVDALVEYVDVYPTLCELAGLSRPFQLQGESLVPFLEGKHPPEKDAVFCRWYSGETIITRTHAYTEWIRDGTSRARMLYDHRIDLDETVNISELPENRELVEALHKRVVEHMAAREKIHLPKPTDAR